MAGECRIWLRLQWRIAWANFLSPFLCAALTFLPLIVCKSRLDCSRIFFNCPFTARVNPVFDVSVPSGVVRGRAFPLFSFQYDLTPHWCHITGLLRHEHQAACGRYCTRDSCPRSCCYSPLDGLGPGRVTRSSHSNIRPWLFFSWDGLSGRRSAPRQGKANTTHWTISNYDVWLTKYQSSFTFCKI